MRAGSNCSARPYFTTFFYRREVTLYKGSILALSVTYGDTSPKGRGLGKKMNFSLVR